MGRPPTFSAAMQNIVIAKPYVFVPPHRGDFWPKLFAKTLPGYLRKNFGIANIATRGLERLDQSIAAGHSIMLTPNHCRPCDPFVLACAISRPAFVMASWHLFMQSRLQRFLLPRIGVFSVYREGMDRDALKCAIQLLTEAKRPLIVFPEGVISRHNDKLNNLMDGPALMLRSAAKQRAEAGGKVVVHPVAIRYFFNGDLEAAVKPVLAGIEKRLAWQTQDSLPLIERILKCGVALLSLKEIEFFGSAQVGTLAERIARLVDRMFSPLEDEWLKGRRETNVVARGKLLRSAILPDLIADDISEAERQRRWRQLEIMYFAQQIAFYPPGYLTSSKNTPERLLEVVEKLEEDLTDTCRIHSPMRAVVEVGEAIEVSKERQRSPDGDPLMNTIRERLETRLAALLAEGRPN
ncbi:MAG: 1-acyl-sn-glycerol-3-phosphate acyltransferase [Pedosphaera sp.]|nr:1-acyl-sn-glycerol-3-phosphate acyltransferase [Pedosphaera sp.]